MVGPLASPVSEPGRGGGVTSGTVVDFGDTTIVG